MGEGVLLFSLCDTLGFQFRVWVVTHQNMTSLFFGHFFNLFLSELNHRLGDSALLLSDFMLPAMDGVNRSKVTLRPLDRRKSLEHKCPYTQEGRAIKEAVAWVKSHPVRF